MELRKKNQHLKIKDTIPATLKQYFFTDKPVPNLLQEYDAVGFDADNCFVKYNVVALSRLIIKEYLADLHENFDYPVEVT